MNIIVKCNLLWWSKYLFQQNTACRIQYWWPAVLKRPGQHYLIFVRTTSHADDTGFCCNTIWSYPQTRCQRKRLSLFLKYCVFHICLDVDVCFLTAADTQPISQPPELPTPYPQLQNEHFPADKQQSNTYSTLCYRLWRSKCSGSFWMTLHYVTIKHFYY